MKKLFIIFLLSICQNSVFSQKITENYLNNVRILVPEGLDIKFDCEMNFSLTHYIGYGTSEYYIYASFDIFDKQRHNFPCNTKLILSIYDGSQIELTAVITEMDPIGGEFSSAMAEFPITIEQLKKLFTGVNLIKMDVLKYKGGSKVDRIVSEKKFKKDIFGNYLKRSYEAIENVKRIKNYH